VEPWDLCALDITTIIKREHVQEPQHNASGPSKGEGKASTLSIAEMEGSNDDQELPAPKKRNKQNEKKNVQKEKENALDKMNKMPMEESNSDTPTPSRTAGWVMLTGGGDGGVTVCVHLSLGTSLVLSQTGYFGMFRFAVSDLAKLELCSADGGVLSDVDCFGPDDEMAKKLMDSIRKGEGAGLETAWPARSWGSWRTVSATPKASESVAVYRIAHSVVMCVCVRARACVRV
jgi:hypothetical protein